MKRTKRFDDDSSGRLPTALWLLGFLCVALTGFFGFMLFFMIRNFLVLIMACLKFVHTLMRLIFYWLKWSILLAYDAAKSRIDKVFDDLFWWGT